jgi:hypothetical protein
MPFGAAFANDRALVFISTTLMKTPQTLLMKTWRFFASKIMIDTIGCVNMNRKQGILNWMQGTFFVVRIPGKLS